mmetsp:Transcript_98331/g.283750  ORF Transcript_98331/g.283750 Transcript_98331/m.283750 type:complete len:208 (-) Transcript_98331:25-648(-)
MRALLVTMLFGMPVVPEVSNIKIGAAFSTNASGGSGGAHPRSNRSSQASWLNTAVRSRNPRRSNKDLAASALPPDNTDTRGSYKRSKRKTCSAFNSRSAGAQVAPQRATPMHKATLATVFVTAEKTMQPGLAPKECKWLEAASPNLRRSANVTAGCSWPSAPTIASAGSVGDSCALLATNSQNGFSSTQRSSGMLRRLRDVGVNVGL